MTERLYFDEPSLLDFEARIVESVESSDGWTTVLDRSAFYPTSGGQLHDTGIINEVAIGCVVLAPDGTVQHLSATCIGEKGEIVRGRVDAARRWRHRQAHTAQHILSQAFVRLNDIDTVSVHLGEEYSAIELDIADLSATNLERAAKLANDIVLENLPVTISFVSQAEAATLPLRKVPAVKEAIRIIQIGEFDWSACGGTHCHSTGEVRLIQIVGVEKVRGHSLVRFLSGEMARQDYEHRLRITQQLTVNLTCGLGELCERIDGLSSEIRGYRATIASLQKELMPHRAAELAARAKSAGNIPWVAAAMPSLDQKAATILATEVASRIDGLAILLTHERIVLAAAKESGLSASSLVKEICARIGRKGGGNDRLAQFGPVEAGQFKDVTRQLVEIAANHENT